MKSKLSIGEQHQERIAKQTLKMPDAMVGVMGGMTKIGARTFLLTIGYTPEQVKNLEK